MKPNPFFLPAAFLLPALLLPALLLASGRPVVGAVDTDVNPDDAVVFLDGKALGRADEFDGWPAYLALPPGSYTLEFRLEGYEGFKAAVRVEPWRVVQIEKRLIRVPPSSIADISPPEEEVEEIEPETPPPSEPAANATARLALTVTPENAVIYLDGVFWMTGEDLARMHSPLQIPAGRHTLLCYAPGYEEMTQELEAEPGELIEAAVVLVEK